MKTIKFFTSIIICQLAGVLGSLFMLTNSDNWYQNIVKPTWTPASWVFGPVWITLYTLIGVALYLIWIKKDSKVSFGQVNIKKAIYIFSAQLILNAIWTPIFFYYHNILLAFIDIILLLFLIVWTMFEFNKINKWAMYLLVPYLLWVCLATALNYNILILN